LFGVVVVGEGEGMGRGKRVGEGMDGCEIRIV
jgi:hypothetical protein